MLLWEKCRTQDQRDHWDNVRRTFQDIHISLKAYFGGKEKPVFDYPEDYQLIAQLGVRRYLALYDVIWEAWTIIKQWAEEINANIPPTPGAYLAACIENECVAIFDQCQTYTEFRPQKQYRFSLEFSKIEQLKSRENLSAKDRNRIKKFDTEVRKIRHSYKKFWALHDFALAAVRSSGDEQTKESLKRYDATCLKLESAINNPFHPTMKRKGYTWKGGKKEVTKLKGLTQPPESTTI